MSDAACSAYLVVCADQDAMDRVMDRLQPYQKAIIDAPKYSAIRGARRINTRSCCNCGRLVDHQEEPDICYDCICKWFSESQQNSQAQPPKVG